jgi:predicted peroxiredoxin
MIKVILVLFTLSLSPLFSEDILFTDAPQKVIKKPQKITEKVVEKSQKVIKKVQKLIQKPQEKVEKVTKFSQKEAMNPLFGKKMVIVVSSDEIEKAGMGITLGLNAAKKGAETTIVLGAKALKFALLDSQQDIFPAKKMTHRDILLKAIENGAHVQVCYMCAQALGLTQKDFIEGATIVKSLKIFDKIYEHGAKVLSF